MFSKCELPSQRRTQSGNFAQGALHPSLRRHLRCALVRAWAVQAILRGLITIAQLSTSLQRLQLPMHFSRAGPHCRVLDHAVPLSGCHANGAVFAFAVSVLARASARAWLADLSASKRHARGKRFRNISSK